MGWSGSGVGVVRRRWNVSWWWGGRRARIGGVVGLALLLLPFLAGCNSAPAGKALVTPTATPWPVIASPAPLAKYHVFVTDLVTGDVSELGVANYHVSKSVHGLALSPDGSTLYVSDIANNRLVAYKLSGGTLNDERSAGVGIQPVHMAQTLDGSTIYVSDFGAATVSVVSTATWTQRASITVPANPHSIVLSPDGRWVYAACYGGAAIAVIDAASATLVGTIALPKLSQPYGLTISNDGLYLYATDNRTGRLFVVNAAARAVVGIVPVGLHPALIARSPDGQRLYIANGGSHSVSVLSLANEAQPTTLATIQVDGYPHGIAVTPDGRYVVVANTLGQNLSVVDTRSLNVIDTITAEKFPNDVLITQG